MHAFVHVETQSALFSVAFTLFAEAPTVSELNPELASIAAQSSQLALSVPCFHFLSVVITREPQCLPGFYVGSGDLNSCPGTCSKHFNNQTIFIAHTWGLNGILC